MILVIDTYNLLHRARSGFTKGEHAVAFNFFRALRALVEQFNPTRVYMAIEGHAKFRYELLPEYKANRAIEPGSKKAEELDDFNRQKAEIISLLGAYFPVSCVWHRHYEADDTIANIVDRSSTTAEFVVVSTDTDFTQLLSRDNVRVYNPVKKAYVEWNKDDDYVLYKALKGDSTDNIPGIPGFGEKKAMKVAKDSLANPLKPVNFGLDIIESDGYAFLDTITRNIELVRFKIWNDAERDEMGSSHPTKDWDAVRALFEEWQFASIVNDKSWQKFVGTFDPLFGKE